MMKVLPAVALVLFLATYAPALPEDSWSEISEDQNAVSETLVDAGVLNEQAKEFEFSAEQKQVLPKLKRRIEKLKQKMSSMTSGSEEHKKAEKEMKKLARREAMWIKKKDELHERKMKNELHQRKMELAKATQAIDVVGGCDCPTASVYTLGIRSGQECYEIPEYTKLSSKCKTQCREDPTAGPDGKGKNAWEQANCDCRFVCEHNVQTDADGHRGGSNAMCEGTWTNPIPRNSLWYRHTKDDTQKSAEKRCCSFYRGKCSRCCQKNGGLHS